LPVLISDCFHTNFVPTVLKDALKCIKFLTACSFKNQPRQSGRDKNKAVLGLPTLFENETEISTLV